MNDINHQYKLFSISIIKFCLFFLKRINDLLISSSEINQIGNAKELISCNNSISGKSLKIACNCDNLLEALNIFDSEELNLNYINSLKPFTITSDNENNLLQVLLPIKVD